MVRPGESHNQTVLCAGLANPKRKTQERTAHICAAVHASQPFSPAPGLLAMSHCNEQLPAAQGSVALYQDFYAIP